MQIVSVNVTGEYALFSRPEMSVERVSYPIMTPSSARGICDAIMFRPQMTWGISSITVLQPDFPAGFPESARTKPFRLMGLRRNEIQDRISSKMVEGWMREPANTLPYLVDSAGRESSQGSNRTQRNSMILQHVAYRIDAYPILTSRANLPRTKPLSEDEPTGPDSEIKYAEMFRRRVRKGQCFHHPYLGCREFACYFTEPKSTDVVLNTWTESLGLMLYDIQFGANNDNRPGFFHANIVRGVLHCDRNRFGIDGQRPVKILGWTERNAG